MWTPKLPFNYVFTPKLPYKNLLLPLQQACICKERTYISLYLIHMRLVMSLSNIHNTLPIGKPITTHLFTNTGKAIFCSSKEIKRCNCQTKLKTSLTWNSWNSKCCGNYNVMFLFEDLVHDRFPFKITFVHDCIHIYIAQSRMISSIYNHSAVHIPYWASTQEMGGGCQLTT